MDPPGDQTRVVFVLETARADMGADEHVVVLPTVHRDRADAGFAWAVAADSPTRSEQQRITRLFKARV
jgi:hypothetical protein